MQALVCVEVERAILRHFPMLRSTWNGLSDTEGSDYMTFEFEYEATSNEQGRSTQIRAIIRDLRDSLKSLLYGGEEGDEIDPRHPLRFSLRIVDERHHCLEMIVPIRKQQKTEEDSVKERSDFCSSFYNNAFVFR